MTMISQLSEKQTKQFGYEWKHRYKEKHVRFIDEENEGLMLHTKSVVRDQTRDYIKTCKSILKKENDRCKLGFPWPDGEVTTEIVSNKDGYLYNCFVDETIEDYWVPKFYEEVKKHPKMLF